MVATALCQLPQPSGMKIQAMAFPITARMEWLRSSTMPKLPFSTPKAWRNQSKIADSRMTVPAFLIKDQARSHIERSTLPTVGR